MFKQHRVRWVGAYYSSLAASGLYVGFFSTIGVMSIVWHDFNGVIRQYVPWVNFPIFMAVALVGYFVVLPFVHYKFVQRSVVEFGNQQAYKHDNPLVKDIQELKK